MNNFIFGEGFPGAFNKGGKWQSKHPHGMQKPHKPSPELGGLKGSHKPVDPATVGGRKNIGTPNLHHPLFMNSPTKKATGKALGKLPPPKQSKTPPSHE